MISLALNNKKRGACIDTPFLSDQETLMMPVPLFTYETGNDKCYISGLKTGSRSFTLKNEYLFNRHPENAGNVMSQLKGGIVFVFLQEDDCFTAYINLPGQVILRQVVTGPVFLDTVIHCVLL